MDTLLTQTSVLIREIQNDLLAYENAQDRETDSACTNVLNNKFQRLLEMCDRLDILVNKEQAQTRAQSRQRVNEIKYDIKHYQTAFNNLTVKKQQRDEYERQRELLLHRKFTPSNPDSNGATHINLDHSLDYSERLDSTHARVDGILEQARLTLDNLRTQGVTFKNIHKKMISLGNMLGLSSTVIHSIERRTASDWWILFGGMIVTLIIMFVLYKWLV
jgi:Golgi SNAP receptor complex protein 2